jgi:hypothetical protein
MVWLIYILPSRRQPCIDQAIDYAALNAKKNAPRWIRQLKAIGKWPATSATAPAPPPNRPVSSWGRAQRIRKRC